MQGEAASPETVADTIPADALAGARVVVFTNQARAAAREHMQGAFLDLGAASAELVHVARSAGPARLDAGDFVVVDLSFMSHADSDAIRHRVRAAGCRYYEGRHGTRGLAAAAARSWLARRRGEGGGH